MRLWFSGPRIMGVRTGISIPLNQMKAKQKNVGQTVEGSFVYVVRGDHNMVKIGVTTNPRARLAQIRTGSAFPVGFAMIGATPGNGYDLEEEAHRLLHARRVNGEWFDVTPEVAIGAVMSAATKLKQPIQLVPDVDTADRVLKIASGESDKGSGRSLFTMLLWIGVIDALIGNFMVKDLGFDAGPVIFGLFASVIIMLMMIRAFARMLGG